MPGGKSKIGTLREKLAPFLQRNPYAKVEKTGSQYYVTNGWDNEHISFVLEPNTSADLITALNNILLPPRFTALYHIDTNTMEYIFTLLPKDSLYFSRHFEFVLEGNSYNCRFERASDRLLVLAKLFRPAGDKRDDRNLMFLNIYTNPDMAQTRIGKDLIADRIPASFFVGEFEAFDEETIVEVSKHINFFMQYYDRDTSYILIHQTSGGQTSEPKQLRFIQHDFPNKISTQRQNPYLLDLALEGHKADDRLKFIYYYQVLEHAAFYYVDESIKRELLKIIATPDIHSDPGRHIPRILDTIGESRQEDEAKIEKTIKSCCDPNMIWQELQQNKTFFCERQEFDGGFGLEPCISADTSLESFCVMWLPKIANCLRYIRNALVHGREKKSGMVISPTPENDIRLRPWLPVIRRIAEQVMIFGRTA